MRIFIGELGTVDTPFHVCFYHVVTHEEEHLWVPDECGEMAIINWVHPFVLFIYKEVVQATPYTSLNGMFAQVTSLLWYLGISKDYFFPNSES